MSRVALPFPRLPQSIALRYAIALVAFAVSFLLREALEALHAHTGGEHPILQTFLRD